ncbi:hypothetical protein ACD578_29035 (plasmid) [Microvirga sp. RSM25]|uniref:hypothetical protein n=1 Tax=Microvirga sp. RSM25 TaxID=3273802 RepID=UPI00384B4FFA
MANQLPGVLQAEIDMARRALHSSWNAVSRAMQARNLGVHINNVLSWVVATPSIEAAASQVGEEAMRYFQVLERQPSAANPAQKEEAAKALAAAEAAIAMLAASLRDAQPSEEARILGTAWT